ncbi:uncharacterized protein [Trachinotus anak]|uniref:uncharacterized protein isoform X1 n=1 Tax=Trachinotus anak TaxID=443729 RepID=UPI0039F20215
MSEIWKSQRKHLACIQDPPGVQLYMQTGTVLKGGHRLPTYRCARGSTSLESFHLHLNRFIPGTLASDTFFQAYLLDGLARWNEDRAVAATTDEQQPHSYNHLLHHAANTLAEEVLGKKIIPYIGPSKYTDELIRVEYLYQQTGKVLQDYKLAIAESETADVDIEVDEGYAELEEFQDITVPTFDTERTPAASSQASVCSIRDLVISNSFSNQLHAISVYSPSIISVISYNQLHAISVCSPSIISVISYNQLHAISVCSPSIISVISYNQLHAITVCGPPITCVIFSNQLPAHAVKSSTLSWST